MIDQKITKYVADWFARADEDLGVAQFIIEEKRPYNPACFHEQQAVEKYLKGFLAHHEKHARKIQDLETLLQECIKIDQSFGTLRENAQYLNRFYIESRYPDDYIEFTSEDAGKGLEFAVSVKKFVLEKIKSQKSGFGIVGIIIIVAALAVLGGFFGYQYRQLQKIQKGIIPEEGLPPRLPGNGKSGIPPQTAPDSVSEIDISNWKTYRNEQYGFEVRYPNDWKVIEGDAQRDSAFLFQKIADYNTRIVVLVDTQQENIDDLAKIKGRKQTIIDGIFSEKLLADFYVAEGREWIVQVKKDRFYYFIQGNGYNEEQENLFDNFLSTFKFIK